MKIKSRNGKELHHGFTLIEMIGVLAVIAILAAVLIPKVFEAINNSRINNAAMSCQTAKTAIADHYAKFGGLAIDGSVNPPVVIDLSGGAVGAYDDMLLKEAFLDKPFAVKITTDPLVDVEIRPTVAANVAPDGVNAAYNLDGDTTAATINKAVGSAVVDCIIPGVTANDAWDLSNRIDGVGVTGGTGLSETAATTADLRGRVKYAAAGATGTTTVYVYLTHR